MADVTCSIEGCPNVVKARGWCKMHWRRWRNTGDPGEAASRRTPQNGQKCTVEGCSESSYKRAWCNAHYIRWRKTGSPTGTLRKTTEEHFWEKVNKTGTPAPEWLPGAGPCWIWTGTQDKRGYTKFKPGGRTVPLAQGHRWAYEHFIGPVPDGLELDHLCRRPSCVNPEHLEPVTHRENVRRGFEARRLGR